MELLRENFQREIDGKPVDLYTIRNRRGMVVQLTNLGAKIQRIVVPDRDGKPGDVALGYDTLDGVINGQASLNAFIGRYAHRIAGGRFTLDGVEHRLALNDSTRPNTLHGGLKGSRFCVFDAVQISPSALELSYTFQDGEEGFPGTLELKVLHTVTEQDELVLAYTATALDRRTVGNFTSHLFFNLSGQGGSSILDHTVTIPAGQVLEYDANLIPTGVRRDVAGTPLDFRQARTIGLEIGADYDLLRYGSGYDQHWISAKEPGVCGFLAKVADPRSGRTLEVYSTEPGLQFYTGNFLEGKVPRDVGKNGDLYVTRSGFCMEPSHFPDSLHHPDFPSTVIEPGHPYAGKIIYAFGVQA